MFQSSPETLTSDEPMNCMEVFGGHGETSNQIKRPGLNVWVRSQPRQDTIAGGGDLYLISSCASGRITRMLMADVCAFGALFNDVALRLRDIMKRNVNSINQAGSVKQMSRELQRASLQGGFASTLMCTYFAPTRSFKLCNAGHPSPLCFRHGTGEWTLLKSSSDRQPAAETNLGVLSSGEYQQVETELEIGDRVLCYSNSLTECRGSDGRTVGMTGLLRRVQRLGGTDPSRLAGDLLDLLRSEDEENLAASDATVLLCEATTTPVAWQDNLLAPLRLFRAATDRTTIERQP